MQVVPCPVIVVLIHNIIIKSFVDKTVYYAQLHMLRRGQRLENIAWDEVSENAGSHNAYIIRQCHTVVQ